MSQRDPRRTRIPEREIVLRIFAYGIPMTIGILGFVPGFVPGIVPG